MGGSEGHGKRVGNSTPRGDVCVKEVIECAEIRLEAGLVVELGELKFSRHFCGGIFLVERGRVGNAPADSQEGDADKVKVKPHVYVLETEQPNTSQRHSATNCCLGLCTAARQ